MSNYTCWFDGSCKPPHKGGSMGIGGVILKDNSVIYQFSEHITGKGSVNLAEYHAVEHLMIYFITNGITNQNISIYGDSLLVVRQLNRSWSNRPKGTYAKKAIEVLELFDKLKATNNITLEWISRKDNDFADVLSKEAHNK